MDKGYSLEHLCGASGSVLARIPAPSLPPMQLVPELAYEGHFPPIEHPQVGIRDTRINLPSLRPGPKEKLKDRTSGSYLDL